MALVHPKDDALATSATPVANTAPVLTSTPTPRSVDLDRKPSIFWLLPDRFDTRQDKSSWLEMARELRDVGWQIKILSARQNASASDYEGLVHYVASINVPIFFRWCTMVSFFLTLFRESRRGDIVMINPDCLWLLPWVRLLGKRRLHLDVRTIPLVTLKGFKQRLDVLLFWTLPTRLFARFADSYSFITKPLQSAFEAEFKFHPSPSSIWQSGVNTTLFKPEHQNAPKNETNNTFTVFYHGGLLRTRGIDTIIRAASARSFPFELRIVLVGDGPDREELVKLAVETGVANKVEFKGFVPYEQVVALLNQADCCICPLPDLPEWRVSSPLKVLEYLACEKQTILTPMPAHLAAASGLDAVIWTRDYTPAAFADGFVEAWKHGPLPVEARRAARRHVVENFEWKVHCDTLNSLFTTRNIGTA